MERVRLAIVVDRPLRGDECLAHDLAPEHPLAIFIGTSPPEDVHLDWFEVEQVKQIGDGSRHALHYGRQR